MKPKIYTLANFENKFSVSNFYFFLNRLKSQKGLNLSFLRAKYPHRQHFWLKTKTKCFCLKFYQDCPFFIVIRC